MKKTVRFLSIHRIGCLLPTPQETATSVIAIEEQVDDPSYVARTRAAAGEADVVLAYAGIINFDVMVALMAQYKDKLRLVSCDCDERRKRQVLEEHGFDPDNSVYWTKSCGGQQKMGELVGYYKTYDEFPKLGR